MKKNTKKAQEKNVVSSKKESVKDLNIIRGTPSDRGRVEKIKHKCDYLYKLGRPFTLVKSGTSYEMFSEMWREKAYGGGFTTKDLHFIKSVKNYVNKKGIASEFCDKDYQSKPIQYIRVSNEFKAGDEVRDLICVDINGAYWQTAYRLGIISRELYRKGWDMGKRVRLAALGGFAKTKSVWSFDGKELRKVAIERSHLENLWFAICAEVAELMVKVQGAIGREGFVFYWVDGIYIRNNAEVANKVMNVFLEAGYTSKFEIIPYVRFNERGFTVGGNNGEREKTFSYAIPRVSSGGKIKKVVSRPITKKVEEGKVLGFINALVKHKGELSVEELSKLLNYGG